MHISFAYAQSHFEAHQLKNTKYIQKCVSPLFGTPLVPHLGYLGYKHKSTPLLGYPRQSEHYPYFDIYISDLHTLSA